MASRNDDQARRRSILDLLLRRNRIERSQTVERSYFERPYADDDRTRKPTPRPRAWRGLAAAVRSGTAAKQSAIDGRSAFDRTQSWAYKKQVEIRDRFKKDDDKRETALACVAEAVKARKENIDTYAKAVDRLQQEIRNTSHTQVTREWNEGMQKRFSGARKAHQYEEQRIERELAEAVEKIALLDVKTSIRPYQKLGFHPLLRLTKRDSAPDLTKHFRQKDMDADVIYMRPDPASHEQDPVAVEPDFTPSPDPEDTDWLSKVKEEARERPEPERPDLSPTKLKL